MGFLRYLLAIAVVIGHSAPIPWFPLVEGNLAVKLFFMVSGFYMGLILTEKYGLLQNGISLYYSNRFLRIMPVFWLVFVIELMTAAAIHRFSLAGDPRIALNADLLASGGILAFAFFVISQIFLIGADVLLLFTWNQDSGFLLHSATADVEGSVRGWRFLLMPHSWTLACEWFFYALVPFLNRLPNLFLSLLIALNIAVAGVLHLWIDPLLAEVALDSLAPLQIGYFATGLMSYRIYSSRIKWTWLQTGPVATLLVLMFAVALIGFHRLYDIGHHLSIWTLMILAALSLPALFSFTRNSWWDRRIGDLSYPIYLLHAIVIRCLQNFMSMWDPSAFDFLSSSYFPITAIFFATLLAWVVSISFEQPLDRFRQKLVARRSGRNR